MAREARQIKRLAGQKTLFKAGLLGPNTLQAEDSPNLYVSKELEKAGEKPFFSKFSWRKMIHFFDGSKTEDEVHDNRSKV